MPSDHALLEATRAGDETAFAEIVRRYRNQITNYIYRMTNDYDGAVDLAQETFVRVFGAMQRYRTDYAFRRTSTASLQTLRSANCANASAAALFR
jgi:RNA polymerase sigma-70 factor (ECF subfamily)